MQVCNRIPGTNGIPVLRRTCGNSTSTYCSVTRIGGPKWPPSLVGRESREPDHVHATHAIHGWATRVFQRETLGVDINGFLTQGGISPDSCRSVPHFTFPAVDLPLGLFWNTGRSVDDRRCATTTLRRWARIGLASHTQHRRNLCGEQ
ncbi:hypothetical protein J6590_001121 [Homalodisca vitripennis]|nr:hypothetical protein J6590_001121 [Homalodisca vitripennis]